jgi:hypothetical protein
MQLIVILPPEGIRVQVSVPTAKGKGGPVNQGRPFFALSRELKAVPAN